MLPLFLRMRIQKEGGKKVNLFLPAFLAWILLFGILLICLPFVLLFALLTWRAGPGRLALLTYPMLVSILWNLGGLYIRVEKPDEIVYMNFK